MKLNRKEAKEKLDSRLTAYGQVHYGGDNIDDIIDELFDSIESIEAENKELKEKHRQRKAQAKRLLGNSTQVSQTQEEKIKELQAKLEEKTELAESHRRVMFSLKDKLEAIESNKVAEFSGQMKSQGDSIPFLYDEKSSKFMLSTDICEHEGKYYTVTISKDNT